MATACATILLRKQARTALRHSSALASQISSSSTSSSSSSSSSPSSSWKPPIAAGKEPAYDEALKYISLQQSRLRQKIPALEEAVRKHKEGTEDRKAAEAELKSHLVASEINDPEVRWKFENNVDAPLSTPVFAHLREKAWRSQRLPKLVERIRLMGVLPDAIPHITPVVDLQVAFGQGEGFHDHGGQGGDVLPGCFVGAEKTINAPTITATAFHSDQRLYTMALVDVDAPYEAEQRLGTYAHWLVHNIPLSLTKTKVDVSAANETLSYIPPHPQSGTKYHRYTLVLFEQSQPITPSETIERKHFSLHDYVKQNALISAGIHFWRAKWSEESKQAISDIYANTLQEAEPEYAKLSRRIRASLY